MRVSELGPHTHRAHTQPLGDGHDELLACGYFRMERLRIEEPRRMAAGVPYYRLLICLRGSGSIAGQEFSIGQAWFVPAGAAGFELDGKGSEWLLTYSPDQPDTAIGV